MNVRNGLIASLAGLLVVVGILILYQQYGKEEKKADLSEIVPENTAILLAINDLPRLSELLADSGTAAAELSRLMKAERSMLAMLADRNAAWVKLPQNEAGQLAAGWLIIQEVNEELQQTLAFNHINQKEFKRWIKSQESLRPLALEANDSPVYPITIDTLNYFLTYQQGFMLLSSSLDCLNGFSKSEIQNEKSQANPDFLKIYTTANRNAVANLFLQHKYLPRIADQFGFKGNRAVLQNLSEYGSWTEWDLTFTDSEIFLNGFTLTADHQQNLQATSSFLLNYIPSFSLSYQIVNLSKEGNISEAEKTQKSAIEERMQMKGFPRLESELVPLIDSEIAWVKTSFSERNSGDEVMLIRLKSQIEAENFVRKLHNQLIINNQYKSKDLLKEIPLDDATPLILYRIPIQELPYYVGGACFESIQSEWLGFYQNVLFLAEDSEVLSGYLQEILRRNTLENNSNYRNFAESISENYRSDFYLNLKKSGSYLDQLFNHRLHQFLSPESLEKFQALSVQSGVSQKEGMLSSDILIRFNPGLVEKPQTIWEVGLDSVICTKPAIIINTETNNKEILIQDLSNKLYLISTAGRIIWEKQLEERIISKIIQIKAGPKNEGGILFNTFEQVHFIDQEGNYRNRFPIYLAQKASNGLCLVEGKGKKEAHFLLALEDRSVKMYKLDGNSVQDWKFPGTEQLVRQEILHFTVKDKSVYGIQDGNRIYYLDERGKLSFESGSTSRPSSNPMYWNDKTGSDKKAVVYTDIQGTLIIQLPDGEMKQHNFRTLSENHRFLLADLNGDNRNDYIFSDETGIFVYDYTFTELFSQKFDSPISEMPVIYQFPGGKNRLGIVCAANQKIYLIHENGDVHPGFPLKGIGSFSISSLLKNGNFTLLVGSSDGFLYQYEVK